MALHPLTEDYLKLVLEWRNSPNVRDKMYTSHVISWEEHCAWFERIKDDNTAEWFLYREKNGDAAGVVYFMNINARNSSAFWGFYAAENAPRGIGTRMEYEALEYAFQEKKLHKLNCELLVTNVGVIRLHEKFGFSKEGIFRDFNFDGDKYTDVIRMGILDHEWQQRRTIMLDKLAKFS